MYKIITTWDRQQNGLCDTDIYKWLVSRVLYSPKKTYFSFKEPLKKDQDLWARNDVFCLEM